MSGRGERVPSTYICLRANRNDFGSLLSQNLLVFEPKTTFVVNAKPDTPTIKN